MKRELYDDENQEHQEAQLGISQWQRDHDPIGEQWIPSAVDIACREVRERFDRMSEEEHRFWMSGEWRREVAP